MKMQSAPQGSGALCSELRTSRIQRGSSVSGALRALSQEEIEGIRFRTKGDGTRLRVASDQKTRERAYGLAQRIYFEAGLSKDPNQSYCVAPYDTAPGTITLLLEDSSGRELGTVTLVFDAMGSLPCEDVFSAEMARHRTKGSRIVEITRLAIARDCKGAKQILAQLINLSYTISGAVLNCTAAVIEVHPRHAPFYQRLLGFSRWSGPRPCPRVHGASAVLLALPLEALNPLESANPNRLPLNSHQMQRNRRLAEQIVHSHRPMTRDQARYFGLGTV